MKSFRNPKYIERYEDVFFELETPLNTGNPGNNNSQKKTGYRFVVDNTGEVTPFDWYNARMSLDFKVQTMVILLVRITMELSMAPIYSSTILT